MNKTKATIASMKDTSILVRAVFGPGMLLQSDDLEQLNSYTRELSRLLFRSFFGCGVVCGLVVSVAGKCGKDCVTVQSGLALDCSGDPIYVPKEETFVLDEDCQTLTGSFYVLLCRTQKCCAPRTSMCSCDDDGATSECTRERDCFEIRVVRDLPACVCHCSEPRQDAIDSSCFCVDPTDACYTSHYAGECGCRCEDGSSCDCNCVVLALITAPKDVNGLWTVDHGVRRFIRPVLMRDPQFQAERDQRDKKAAKRKETIEKEQRVERQFEELAERENQLKKKFAEREMEFSQREHELREELRRCSEHVGTLEEEVEQLRKEEAKSDDEKKPKQPKAAKKEGG